MGVLTKVFQATDAEREEVARGWKVPPPLPPESKLVLRDVRNPFTGRIQSVRVREPAPAPLQADEEVEEHPDIEQLPWLEMDGLSPELLDTLGVILLGWPPDRCEVSAGDLAGPDGDISLIAVPDRLRDALAEVPASGCAALADEWVTQETTRSGRKLERSAARAALSTLCDFATSALQTGRSLYLWMCP